MRKVVIFWGVVLTVFAAGGAYLQYLGPPVPSPRILLAQHALPAGSGPRTGLPGSGVPRLALVIGGVGLDADLSRQVLRDLPANVSVVLSAHTPDPLQAELSARLHAQGRECLMAVPMEPPAAPRDDAGPHALRRGADAAENRRNLDWALARAPGCAAATNLSDGFDGGGYLASAALYGDLIAQLRARGLAWFDGRENARALPGGAAVLHADVVLDSADDSGEPPAAQSIDARLQALLLQARSRGQAVGVIALPGTLVLARLQHFLAGLDPHAALLVKLSELHPSAAES